MTTSPWPPADSTWMALERHWRRVMDDSPTFGSRSGGWQVRKEYSGEGLGPIAGDFDQVAIYHNGDEIARYDLEALDTDADGYGGAPDA